MSRFLLPLMFLAAAASPALAQPWRITVDGRANCGVTDAPGPQLQLAPGEYDITPVSGAINVWSANVDCDANGGNCDAGYMFLLYVRIGNGPAFSMPPTCCPRSDRWATPELAAAHATVSTFTVPGPDAATVKFFFLDNPCADNIGAVTADIAPHPPACPADFNDDGFLDFFDADAFTACFEGTECPAGKTADFNRDDFVDFFDLDAFLAAFEAGC